MKQKFLLIRKKKKKQHVGKRQIIYNWLMHLLFRFA